MGFWRELFWVLSRQPQFVIEIRAGQAHPARFYGALFRGPVPPGFLRECSEVARLTELETGLILGLKRDTGIQLLFSHQIPEFTQQRLRNLWQIYS